MVSRRVASFVRTSEIDVAFSSVRFRRRSHLQNPDSVPRPAWSEQVAANENWVSTSLRPRRFSLSFSPLPPFSHSTDRPPPLLSSLSNSHFTDLRDQETLPPPSPHLRVSQPTLLLLPSPLHRLRSRPFNLRPPLLLLSPFRSRQQNPSINSRPGFPHQRQSNPRLFQPPTREPHLRGSDARWSWRSLLRGDGFE